MHTRRQTLQTLASLSLASLARADGRRGVIAEENAKPGTRDWMLTTTKIDSAVKYRCPWIEGFASAMSVRAGETVRFL